MAQGVWYRLRGQVNRLKSQWVVVLRQAAEEESGGGRKLLSNGPRDKQCTRKKGGLAVVCSVLVLVSLHASYHSFTLSLTIPAAG